MNKRLVIVGAVAAGASAAAKARRSAEGIEIVLMDAGQHMSYANCGLPYYLGGEIAERDSLFVVDAEGFAKRFNVDVRLGTRADALCLSARTLTAHTLDGRVQAITYDRLILATGTVPVVPPIPGLFGPDTFLCRTVPDVDAIDARRLALTPNGAGRPKALIIGGGFIGLECADQFLARGMEVTVVELAPQLLPPLDPEMAIPVQQALESAGAMVAVADAVVEIDRGRPRAVAVLKSGRTVVFDLAIVAVGVRPNVALAETAGLALGATGAIAVDEHQRTSDDAVYAAGDNSESRFIPTGGRINVALAGPANKQGRVAGTNAALDLLAATSSDGRRLRSGGVLGTGIVRAGGMAAGVTGLSERRAGALGVDIDVTYVHGSSHAGYYPGAEPLLVKLIWEPASGRLLGAQSVGREGVDKRLDVLATAIHGRLNVEDLEQLDLAYAPPFASAKDAEIMAGYVAANALRGSSPTISPAEFVASLTVTDFGVLDVRDRAEYDVAHFNDSINIPLDELRDRIGEVPPDPLVVVCASGYRSYIAQRILYAHGRLDVRNLSGGWRLVEQFRAASAPLSPVS